MLFTFNRFRKAFHTPPTSSLLEDSPGSTPPPERPLRMVLCGLNYAPELTGIGKYSGELVEWLSAHGHEITVITAPPYYPEWRIGQGFSATPHFKLWYSTERHGSVKVIRCPIWVPKQACGLKRIIHLMTFALSALPPLLLTIFARPDIYLAIAPAFFSAPMTWLAARLARAKCWLHIQDFELDVAFELGLLKGETLRTWVERFERWVLSGFDRVSSISPNMVERLWQKGVSPQKTSLFRNWVDIEHIYPMTGENAFRRELDIPDDALVALYSGNMGRKQGLEILANAAARLAEIERRTEKATAEAIEMDGESASAGFSALNDEDNETASLNAVPPIVFVFCGEGVGRQDLMDLCEGCTNVRFLQLQPIERLNELLNLADIHLLPQRAGAADLVMPSKLSGMLASGKPVIATTEAGTQIAEALDGCGLTVKPEDTSAFILAIETLASGPSLRITLGTAGRRTAVEELSREAMLKDFSKKVSSLCYPEKTNVHSIGYKQAKQQPEPAVTK